MKLYHGQRVSCEIEGVKIDDARVSVELNRHGNALFHLCQNVKPGVSTYEKFGYKYSWFFNLDAMDKYKIKPLEEEGFRPKVGDIVRREFGDRKKVLEVFKNTCVLSCTDKFDMAWSAILTFTELEALGYKIETQEPEPIKELTRQEIADKFGIPLERLVIKEN